MVLGTVHLNNYLFNRLLSNFVLKYKFYKQMKKVLRTGLGICMLLIASCEDYSDDFTNLNERIDTLESQIEGFSELSTGISALDTKIGALNTVVNAIPNNDGFSSSVTDIQDKIDMLEEALALLLSNSSEANIGAIEGLSDLLANASGDNLDALADLGGTLQEQVDALNLALGIITGDIKTLLNANNVYPGDLVITDAGALEAALAFVEERETLIIDGAFVLDMYGNVGSSFDAIKVNQLTSKIVAILGHSFKASMIDDYYEDPIGEIATITFGGEVKEVNGNLDFSNLRYLNGYMEIGNIEGDLDMSALQQYSFMEMVDFTEWEGDLFDRDAEDVLEDELDYIYDDEIVEQGGLIMDNIQGNVNLSSLINAYSLGFEDLEGEVDLSALISVNKHLWTNAIEGLKAPQLQEVGANLILDYPGGYDFPELVSVGAKYIDSDDRYADGDIAMADLDEETTVVNFPKLNNVEGYISVYKGSFSYDYEYDDIYGTIDNEFSSATSVTIFYKFRYDLASFQVPGECGFEERTGVSGFAAPNATSVTVNGDDDDYVDNDLYVFAPKASVTLNVDDANGHLAVNFASLSASGLDYVGSDLILVGNETEGVAPSVTLDALTNSGNVYTNGLDELKMPLFNTEANEASIYGSVNKLELKNIADYALKLAYLEELTVTALDNYFNFSDIALVCEPVVGSIPASHGSTPALSTTLTTVSITGADCNASVELGSNDGTNGYSTGFDAITSLTLGGTLFTAEVVGAQGLETLTTSGTITNWIDVDNTPNTRTTNHTTGTCVED